MADHIDLADMTSGPDDALDAFARRVAAPLRVPVSPDGDFTGRVMAEVMQASATNRPLVVPDAGARAASPWWQRRWQLTVTPLGAVGALAAAAALVIALRLPVASDASTSAPLQAPVAEAPTSPAGLHLVRFELIAPVGARVSLVGDFNGWDRSSTMLAPAGTADAAGRQRYMVSLELPRGRHEYAFVLDDSTWTEDPAATTYSNEFGTPTSVVVVEPVPAKAARDTGPQRSS